MNVAGKVDLVETGRSMHEWIKEHDRDIRLARTRTCHELNLCGLTPAFSERSSESGYYSLFKKVKFSDQEPRWYTRRVKEAIHIRLLPNKIN